MTKAQSSSAVAERHVAAGLRVWRGDIDFHNLSPDRVRIQVRVFNDGEVRSEPAWLRLQAAPLGAFVPWTRDLGRLRVPPIAPGQSTVVATEAEVERVHLPGGLLDVPPEQPRTAMGAEDDGWRAALLRRPRDTDRPQPLPSDPLQLAGRGSVHWAGNLNVMIGEQAVERHMARALRVHPERTNIALFVVGDREGDAYRFALSGSGAAWDPMLIQASNDIRVFMDLFQTGHVRRELAVPVGDWRPSGDQDLYLLVVRPPRDCAEGTLLVKVEQRSSGREAVVEFSLDPAAAGPGCYMV